MKIETYKEDSIFEPRVSIVIPTWRQTKVLEQCLGSLEALDYPSEKLEIILVSHDDVSITFDTRHLIKFLKTDRYKNHAQMRNDAVGIATGEIIGFIDDDVVVSVQWLRNGLKYFFLSSVGVVGGPGVAPKDMSFPEQCSYYTLASPFSSGFNYTRFYNTGRIYEAGENDFILCNNLIRKDCFLKVGGFDEAQMPCEENDLYHRIIKAGWKLFYVSEIEVVHNVKPPMVMMRKVYWYAIGRGTFIVRRPECNMKPRIFIPSLSLLFLCSFGVVSFFSLFARYALCAYALLYLLNMLQHLVFVWRKFNKNPLLWLVLPPITFLFHHSYGLGVIVGIAKGLFSKNKATKMHAFFQYH